MPFEDITSPEGVALDWLNQAIYWTDSGKKVIEAINLDGTYRRTVISGALVNPRGIAVDPYRRLVFCIKNVVSYLINYIA